MRALFSAQNGAFADDTCVCVRYDMEAAWVELTMRPNAAREPHQAVKDSLKPGLACLL